MKQLLVTGGAGFIGSNFIHYLLQESDFDGVVINLDALTYAGNLSNLNGLGAQCSERYHFVHGDIADIALLEKIFNEYKIDSICHFAAESHVDRSIVAPEAFIHTNIVGTYRLLEIAKKYAKQIELFHHISTDEVFGSLGKEGYFTETTAYQPNSPYSASKASSDHLVRAYAHTYRLPVTISNCSNNYGPYQFPEKLIPLMILNALEHKPLPIYGDGQNIRDWLYVRDHCRAIWQIMKQGKRGGTYNIGGNGERSNMQVVENICNYLDQVKPSAQLSSYRQLISFVKDRPGHDQRYAIDFSKLKNELDWCPEESFDSGLRKTIDWYLEQQAWIKNIQSGEYQQWMQKQYGGSVI